MDTFSRQFFAFDTVNLVSIFADDPSPLDDVEAACSRYEHLFSPTLSDSALIAINESGGKPVTVDAELAALIGASLPFCAASDGLYDITMGTVTHLWDFHQQVVPDATAIDEALAHVGWEHVHVDRDTVVLDDPRTRIDLGGIAKGWIADSICAMLKDRGVASACVNLGGNVFVMGSKPNGDAWKVGVRLPLPSTLGQSDNAVASVEVRDSSVVTSGIYERAFTRDGVLYHHILDPRTGYPAKTDLLAATLITPTSLAGDGFTTALIIMGLDRAKRFVEEHDGLEAVFITMTGDIVASSGIGTTIPFHCAR